MDRSVGRSSTLMVPSCRSLIVQQLVVLLGMSLGVASLHFRETLADVP
ncbi:hypothetical protein LINPERPRIM_LOCUS17172 [Linum perenne]